VFERHSEICLATKDGRYVVITERGVVSGYCTSDLIASREFELNNGKNLGKFDEVYVKISDVQEALSHADNAGDSVLSRVERDLDIFVGRSGRLATREALRKLNIIKD
jgi:photosystem II stability/assembly factor-like uncharacterized protein